MCIVFVYAAFVIQNFENLMVGNGGYFVWKDQPSFFWITKHGAFAQAE
jgi:hypothetical protein